MKPTDCHCKTNNSDQRKLKVRKVLLKKKKNCKLKGDIAKRILFQNSSKIIEFFVVCLLLI